MRYSFLPAGSPGPPESCLFEPLCSNADLSASRPGSGAYPLDPGPGRPGRRSGISPTVRGSYVPISAAVKLAVGSFLSDDRSDPGRPAVLAPVFLADVDRDSLVGIALLFQLRFFTTALPRFESAVLPPDTGATSFSCPGPAHLSASCVCRFSSRP